MDKHANGTSNGNGSHEPLHVLTGSEALRRIREGSLTVEAYARALLNRIQAHDAAVKAWAYLDPAFVLEQARALDRVPAKERGPLHGLPIGVKDAIYTKGRYSWTRVLVMPHGRVMISLVLITLV
jgi:hypothetical protein